MMCRSLQAQVNDRVGALPGGLADLAGPQCVAHHIALGHQGPQRVHLLLVRLHAGRHHDGIRREKDLRPVGVLYNLFPGSKKAGQLLKLSGFHYFQSIL